ncbi:hypothetical protein LR48_Vigan07g239600 [Vigna angularis]|uniref:Uncharacterized protein n=1 Tax=Phaseolus angularis TaxID=3914 RepID=A0A0L9V1F6_PHAAN|nr:hypothetical protein LR48_Vigan07g239600 [Vigna angularis]
MYVRPVYAMIIRVDVSRWRERMAPRLPPPPQPTEPDASNNASLPTDVSSCWKILGMGFQQLKGEYKVILQQEGSE